METVLTCFTKISDPIWTINVYHMKKRKNMLSYTEIKFCYIFFQFWLNFESNRGFLLLNSIELILKTWKIFFFWTCFAKLIAEQSSLIQYAWPMYHMGEKLYYHSLLLVLWSLFSFFWDLKLHLGFLFFYTHTVYTTHTHTYSACMCVYVCVCVCVCVVCVCVCVSVCHIHARTHTHTHTYTHTHTHTHVTCIIYILYQCRYYGITQILCIQSMHINKQ